MSDSASARDRIERSSVGPLIRLRRIPTWAIFLVVLGCVVGGLLLHGVASAALLGVVGLLLAWLAYLGWPSLPPQARAVRALVVVAVLAYAAYRLWSG